jgi:hypothetical protein
MINGIEKSTVEMLPISQMLTHLATLAKQREDAGQAFKCVSILMVDQDDTWAGAVGGVGANELQKLLLTARDSLVRGEDSFMVYVKLDTPEETQGPTLPAESANE